MNAYFTTLRVKINTAFNSIESASTKQLWLAFFRVYLAFHLCKQLFWHWPYLQLLYSKHSFIVWTEKPLFGFLSLDWLRDHYLLFHCSYLLLILFMGLGIGRRLTIFAVFAMTVILQRWAGYTLNGGDNLLKFLLLYMCMCDSFQYLTLYPTKEARSANNRALNNAATNVGVYSILLHLSVVYAVSAFGKMHADVWYHGVANYYIMMLARFCGTKYNYFLVNSAAFVVSTTYLTLFWELTFPVFIWHRYLRWVSIGCGVMMHLGIYVFMMIHDFELLFLMTYGFMLNDAEWSAVIKWVRDRIPRSLSGTVPADAGARLEPSVEAGVQGNIQGI